MAKRERYTVYEYTCDLCGYVQQPCDDFWANNFSGGSCTIVEDGMNGTDTRAWEHLCRTCREEIQKAIDVVLVKRGGADWCKHTINHKPKREDR